MSSIAMTTGPISSIRSASRPNTSVTESVRSSGRASPVALVSDLNRLNTVYRE